MKPSLRKQLNLPSVADARRASEARFVEPTHRAAVTFEAGGVPQTRGLPFVRDDGGRADAGYRGTAAGDCVCRAAAIATGRPYQEIYDLINELGKSERVGRQGNRRSTARTGVYKPTTRKLMAGLGLTWTPTMAIGQGTTVHLRPGELPAGRLIVQVTKHIVAVIDGTIHDLDPEVSRDGTRCVYGYWSQP